MKKISSHRDRSSAISIASQILVGQSEISETDKALNMMNNLDEMLNAAHLYSESEQDRNETLIDD
jgi:dsDNA-binding SOS-regulon protein